MVFACVECNVPVTNEVVFTNEEPPHAEDDGSWIDFPPQGSFTIGDPLGWNPEIHPGMSHFYAFNLTDMTNTTRDPERTNGCCESDGMDEMNILCANGHQIGL